MFISPSRLAHEEHPNVRLARNELGVGPLLVQVGKRAQVLDRVGHFVLLGARQRRSALELAESKVLRAGPAILSALVLAPALDKD